MKATKYFLILLALVALFATACNTAKEDEVVADTTEVVTEETVNPIDAWIGKVEAVLAEYEPKMIDGSLPFEDLEAYGKAIAPLRDEATTLKLEENASEEQNAKIVPLMNRMDAIK